jgi:DNA-binding response OmpR family regulator
MSEQLIDAPAGRILIVDDTPANLQFLRATLAARGYAVHPAPDGELALQFVQRTHPDLILLDIMMPGLDGYQVCQRLKASEGTRDIPVIFMTALGDTEEKVSGFQLGAVDYITKPFQVDEMLARVQTHIALHKLQRQLAAQNEQLRQEIAERQRAEHEREQLIGQLQEALANIKTLRGLVPICAACKKIRDDSGYWNQLESFLHSHTEAEFSHGICPECAQQLYGDLYDQAADT